MSHALSKQEPTRARQGISALTSPGFLRPDGVTEREAHISEGTTQTSNSRQAPQKSWVAAVPRHFTSWSIQKHARQGPAVLQTVECSRLQHLWIASTQDPLYPSLSQGATILAAIGCSAMVENAVSLREKADLRLLTWAVICGRRSAEPNWGCSLDPSLGRRLCKMPQQVKTWMASLLNSNRHTVK